MNILVTGGASGLGEAITTMLAGDTGNKIYFTFCKSYTNAKKIEAVFNNTTSIKCDFSNAVELQSLTDGIKQLDLDVLINNAYKGEFLKTHFHKIESQDFLNDFRDNIIPVIEITQAVIKAFRHKKRGKIITILTAGLVEAPPVGSAVYISNKAYLEKLTRVWATENAKFNISSNSISPSFMQTNLTAAIDERIVEQMIANLPHKKLLTPGEVAETVMLLVNSQDHINGTDILMNGGLNIK